MNIIKSFNKLQEINFSELNLQSAGLWPKELKFLLIFGAFFLSIYISYEGYLSKKSLDFESIVSTEFDLRKEFARKSVRASNIEIFRVQMYEMEKVFSQLVDQLPGATEVPSLLEDITQRGVTNGLRITSIDMQEEHPREFYIELPITIKAEGGYHDLGAFVSGLASLPRIVTLHDFSISTIDLKSGLLAMTLQVKTYRYKFAELGK